MNKKAIFLGYSTLILLSFIAVPAGAAPVDCMAGACVVSDGAASIATTTSSEKDLKDVFLNGIEHLDEDEFHICNGLSNSGDCELPSASTATMDEVTNQIVVNYSAGNYTIRMTWTLDGSSTPNQATVDKQLVLTNTNEVTVQLTVLDYTGWDLFNDGANDTAWFIAPNTLRQAQGDITADSIAVDAADFYAVYDCGSATPNCEDIFDLSLTAGTGDLNNNAGPVGPYAEYSWQNNVSLPVSGSTTINRRLVITQATATPVPTLSTWALALAALALLILGAAYLRRT